jgi:hypothetical protein
VKPYGIAYFVKLIIINCTIRTNLESRFKIWDCSILWSIPAHEIIMDNESEDYEEFQSILNPRKIKEEYQELGSPSEHEEDDKISSGSEDPDQMSYDAFVPLCETGNTEEDFGEFQQVENTPVGSTEENQSVRPKSPPVDTRKVEPFKCDHGVTVIPPLTDGRNHENLVLIQLCSH